VSWLADNRHWLLFAATVLSALGTLGVALVGALATVSVLLTGGSLVVTVGGFLLGTLLLGGLTLVFAVALLSTLASRAAVPSIPRSERAWAVLHGLETALPPLRGLGLADRVEPTVEQRRAALTERYVEGELSEEELEAELRALLDDGGEQREPAVERPQVERERER